ncbi:IS66 family insertion sequence element accessory protein TnpA [Paracholeplasma brassicae]|uniref:IS66 family insertion sequence element accessory protein TnpA n=1 Tax=Acholeplasma brassicae TaxID=61635 RepID=UPI003CFEB542
MRNKWRVLVKTYNESDLTMKDFCLKYDVKIHHLQYWLKKFKYESTLTSFVKVIIPSTKLKNH